MTPTPEPKITHAEIVTMFGAAMPIEAAILIQDCDSLGLTIPEMRDRLQAIADAARADKAPCNIHELLDRRLAVYRSKRAAADPSARDCMNRYDSYGVVIEALEIIKRGVSGSVPRPKSAEDPTR